METSSLRELTLRGTLIGLFLTVIFTASNVYLGLKIGFTFSSAIPAAIISMAILRHFSGSNILENNMVQTQASAAGTLSAVIFIIPGLVMVGYWQNFPFWQTFLLCCSGGFLGVMFSIPLRQTMVVKSNLIYPEGVAAAEILKVGELAASQKLKDGQISSESAGLKNILLGSGLAALVTFLMSGLRLLGESVSYWFTAGKAIFHLPMGFSLVSVGAGYLMGMRAGIAIFVGIVISWLIAVPYFTVTEVFPEGLSIGAFATKMWVEKVRFIGVGAMAIAAIWTLLTLIKPVIEGVRNSLRMLNKNEQSASIPRTEQDLSPKVILSICAGVFVVLVLTFHSFVSASGLNTGLAWLLVFSCVIAAFIVGFLIAAACGYMAGLVGSSASPISGVGILATVTISLMLLFIGTLSTLLSTQEGVAFATALAIFSVSVVFAIAAIANDNLQDLKTGYLVKATPWRQQVALLIGCVAGSIVIAPVLNLLYEAYGFSGAPLPRENMNMDQLLSAPQAVLMSTIATGIFSKNIQWDMILIGVVLGIIFVIVDLGLKKVNKAFALAPLAVCIGIYLPPNYTMPMVVGALLSWYVAWVTQRKASATGEDATKLNKEVQQKGTMLASGFIVGETIMGVLLAFAIVASLSSGRSDAPFALTEKLQSLFGDHLNSFQTIGGLAIFIFCCLFLVAKTVSNSKK